MQDPHVEYAQPDYEMRATLIPNDPYYQSSNSWGQGYDDLWGLKRINAAQAWDITQGQGVVVAVVDTGLDMTHPDIAANVWTHPDEIAGNGVDDDGNGYIDDVHGWDFANGDNDPTDRHGHGTHVAGTIAAVGNNGIGVIGVAPQAKIMPLKGLSDAGSGLTSDLAQGILYAAQQGADVINNSWGCQYGCVSNPVAEDAVRTAVSLGAVAVFAAGNETKDVAGYSPQNMFDPKPIVVSAVTETSTLAYFSNFGTLIDVAAPGSGLTTPPPTTSPFRNVLSLKSAVCHTTELCPSSLIVGGQYLRQAGTSMAAPHVSGVMALLVGAHSTETIGQLKERLYGGAGDLGALGIDPQFGFGGVDALAAVQTPQPFLLARIMKPIPQAEFGQQGVVISGTAGGTSFSRYDMQVGQGSDPTAWSADGIALASSGKVLDGILATWNNQGVASGPWTIRLIVSDATGNVKEARVTVSVDNTFQWGWPQPVSQGAGSASPVAGDLDGDGSLEVVAGSVDGLVYAWRYDGTLVQGFPVSVGGEVRTIALGDLDDNGALEIAIGVNTAQPEKLFLFRHDGTSMPGWPKSLASGHSITVDVVLADLDGDRDLELLVPENDARMHAYHHDGTVVAGWPVSVQQSPYVSAAAVGDLDGDGRPEVVAAESLNPPLDGLLYAWHGDGTPVYYGWPTPIMGSVFQPALGDINGDGDLEVVIGVNQASAPEVLAFDGHGLLMPGWPKVVGAVPSNGRAACLGDLDDDGTAEVIIPGSGNYLHALKGDGTALPGWPVHLNAVYLSSCVVGDIDGDGRKDVLLGANDVLEALRHDGTRVAGWPKSGASFYRTPLIADLDQDGDVEVVAVLGSLVNVWDLPGPYTPTTMEWPMIGQNARHTALLSAPNRAPALVPIGPQTVNEGQPLVLTVSADDPNYNPITYDASPLPLGASVDATTGQFAWTPDYAQAGSYPVTFTASDGTLTDEELVTITVTNVPRPDLVVSALSVPSSAMLIAPGASFALNQTIANIGTSIVGGSRVGFHLSSDVTYGGSDDIAFSASRTVGSLAVNASSTANTTLTIPTSTTVGNYFVCAMADSLGDVVEELETNNSRCFPTTIRVELPDVTASNLSGPAAAVTGSSVTLAVTVRNTGIASAGKFSVAAYLSLDATITTADTRIGTRAVTSLAPGASLPLTISGSIASTQQPRTYYLGAIADYANAWKETSESNNATTGPSITVSSGTDFMVTALSGPATAIRGQTISLTSAVMNQGPGTAPSSVTGLYLSTDGAITTADLRLGTRAIGSLAPGASNEGAVSVVVPSTVAPGVYSLGAIADYANKRHETDETNNARVGPVMTIQ